MKTTMKTRLRILYMEDSANDVALVEHAMNKAGLTVDLKVARTGADYLAAVDHDRFDLILSDNSVLGFDGISAFEVARETQPDTPFIFLSGFASKEQAVQKQRATGATDCVSKSELQLLADAIVKAVHSHQASLAPAPPGQTERPSAS